jgi:CRP-like cAMP-binding protein
MLSPMSRVSDASEPGMGPLALAPRRLAPMVTEPLPADAPVRNLLLSALPARDAERVREHLEPVRLRHRELLFAPGEPVGHVYFPETAVVSLVSRMHDDRIVEVGTAGCEGMVGLSVFLGDDASPVEAVVQVPGVGRRMRVDAFSELAAPDGAMHRRMLRFTQAFLIQVSQTAVCNAVHLVEQRCAHWLLMTHDRAEGDAFPLTHEFLAFMLGVRRAGVTVAMHALEDAGIVDGSRGRVEVIDRSALERASCECYRIVRAHFDRLLSPES